MTQDDDLVALMMDCTPLEPTLEQYQEKLQQHEAQYQYLLGKMPAQKRDLVQLRETIQHLWESLIWCTVKQGDQVLTARWHTPQVPRVGELVNGHLVTKVEWQVRLDQDAHRDSYDQDKARGHLRTCTVWLEP